MNETGKYLVVIGLLITAIGLIWWLAGSKFTWFGNLPGDIKVEKPGFTFYAPLASMLLVSIVLSLLLWVAGRFMGK
ncbi:DUF2905 domain-containing protein [Sphingobacteriales bacterium UPWRP_1]|nr:hypothetical protein BVG80_16905 [Sphingobacteriales bacterium TSM_CSM]PSJ74327.1 DUF2905 domain-containing protein [Sphingobacteriales bacterium UPWRP_1]